MAVNPTYAEPLIGVNQTDLGWLPETERTRMLADMAHAGVQSVRMTLVPPFEASLHAVADANAVGLKVLVNLNPNFPPFYPPAVAAVPTASGAAWPLSALDVDVLRRTVSNIWEQVRARKLTIDTIEFGNEINWGDFNADLRMKVPGDQPNSGQLASVPGREKYLEGLARYVGGLKVIQELREQGVIDPATHIVAGGFALVTLHNAPRLSIEFVDARQTLSALKSLGSDQYVDGYSVHFYPSVATAAATEDTSLDDVAEFCKGSVLGKPCWITEWGIPNKPDGEAARLSIARDVMRRLSTASAEPNLAGLYYFDWHETKESGFSIWRDEHLTDLGRIVTPGPK